MYSFIQFLNLIRAKHWIKNLVVFIPLFFAGRFLEFDLYFPTFIMFFAFCCASSSIYIMNDYVDIENDKKHPEKRNRPLANGFFTKTQAIIFFILLVLLLIGIGYYLQKNFIYVGIYFILNLFYSFYLKNISIIDVACISSGFVLRVLGGGAATDTSVSHWMIIIFFLLTISIAFAKRRDDLEISKGKLMRKAQAGYSFAFLDVAKSISLSITLMAYILYTLSDEVIQRLGTNRVYITSLFVFLGIMRYLQISIVEKNAGSPVKVMLKDRFLQVIMLCWVISFIIILYGKYF